MMKNKLFATLFLLFLSIPTTAREPVEYVLRFNFLSLMAPSDQGQYLERVRRSFRDNKDLKIDQLLASYSGNNDCRKKNQRTCFAGLYGENQCIKKGGPSGWLCAAKSIDRKIQFRYFQEDSLNQAEWITFANKITAICKDKKNHQVCKLLIEFKGKTKKIVKLIKPIPEGIL